MGQIVDASERSLILVVGDEGLIATLRDSVESAGYNVVATNDAESAVIIGHRIQPQFIVIEGGQPSLPSEEVCRRMRSIHELQDTPIALLVPPQMNGRASLGSAMGPVDFIEKISLPTGLIVWLRRTSQNETDSMWTAWLRYDDIFMDLRQYRVYRRQRRLHLSPKEYKLLRCLLENPGEVLSRDCLRKEVWGDGVHVVPRTIDVHIGRLRQILTADGEQNCIRSVRSVGYALDLDDT